MSQEGVDLSRLTISSRSGIQGDILTLSEGILLRIISYLDLRTIGRLSRACRLLYKLTGSDELWRPICRALVGPWIHQPLLISKQTPTSGRSQQKPAVPSDWTEDPNCYPLSQFTDASSAFPRTSPAMPKIFTSWHDFGIHFIIPNFHFFGWHISNKSPACEIILVTYDTLSGGLIFEQVTCLNFFNPIKDRPCDATILGLPLRLPIDRIHLEPDGLQYRISSSVEDVSNVGFAMEIFTPMYSVSSFFTIPPSRVYGLSSNSYGNLPRKTYLWEDFMLTKNIAPIRHAEKIVAPRSDVRLRSVMNEVTKDLVTNPGDVPKQLMSFTFSRGPDRRNFFPIDGPIINYGEGKPKGLVDGLWVGVNCCSRDKRQIEFGKIFIEQQSNSHRQLRFLRLTGGRPELIWHVGIHHGKPIPSLTLDQALYIDFGLSPVNGSWLKGQGKLDAGINSWQDIETQFINVPEVESNESNVNQIRVKWFIDERITSYYRVQFDSTPRI